MLCLIWSISDSRREWESRTWGEGGKELAAILYFLDKSYLRPYLSYLSKEPVRTDRDSLLHMKDHLLPKLVDFTAIEWRYTLAALAHRVYAPHVGAGTDYLSLPEDSMSTGIVDMEDRDSLPQDTLPTPLVLHMGDGWRWEGEGTVIYTDLEDRDALRALLRQGVAGVILHAPKGDIRIPMEKRIDTYCTLPQD
ncbi:hypothetical protein KIPB_000644 [Kipferlia bialata]|uniref:Uncharacterized protein n=1 Tax=Kipferlia bialata TaxID=797122 RepID=A0A9K3GEJ8_9EUKA|nr:hypothetical protein KIPB_000644 [Kipferlia bialata]|eukprot:g644.t1